MGLEESRTGCQSAWNWGPGSARNGGPPVRLAVGCPGSPWEDPQPSPRAATSAGGDGRGRWLWTHRVNRRQGVWGEDLAAVPEPPALIAGFNDVAMVSERVEQRGGHLGVAEHGRPLAEGEVGGDDDRGALIEPADEME